MKIMNASTEKLLVSPASPCKRVFAWVYDTLPVAGVFVLTFVVGFALMNLVLFNKDAAQVSALIRNHPLWWAYLVIGSSMYFLYCWRKGGQTVGMRTWRIQLVKSDGRFLSKTDCVIRAFLSFGGLANIWAFIDDENRGWHDIAVDAFVVQLPKTEKTAEQKKPLI
jgi:uncharacterized RDD family membrane protein YckC